MLTQLKPNLKTQEIHDSRGEKTCGSLETLNKDLIGFLRCMRSGNIRLISVLAVIESTV